MKRRRVPGTLRPSAVAADALSEGTFWNGEPTPARRVTVVVGDSGAFAGYWARDLVGQRRDAVEVSYGGEMFYLDDDADPRDPGSRPGSGWGKVTVGRGSPRFGHRELEIQPGTVEERP